MKSRRWILTAIILTIFGGSAALKGLLSGRTGEVSPVASGGRRIVSLAPSTTEILFALGLGDRVVGVTRYCVYPEEAQNKTKVGGYINPSYEVLLELKPDLVVTLPEHDHLVEPIEKLGFNTLFVDHHTVAGILDSITLLGNACDAKDRALTLRMELERRINRMRSRTVGVDRPRVLVSVGRTMNGESVRRVTACGQVGFFDELIRLAGGTNAMEQDIPFPAVSPEGVVAMKPDVIIELAPDLRERGSDPETVRREWESIPGLGAVRVSVVSESYAIVPGPRFILLLEDMARAIHPEIRHD